MHAYAHALVSDDELEELSGYEQAARQIKWLDDNGIGYRLRRDGKPRTTWGAVDHALTVSEHASSGPDLSWIQ